MSSQGHVGDYKDEDYEKRIEPGLFGGNVFAPTYTYDLAINCSVLQLTAKTQVTVEFRSHGSTSSTTLPVLHPTGAIDFIPGALGSARLGQRGIARKITYVKFRWRLRTVDGGQGPVHSLDRQATAGKFFDDVFLYFGASTSEPVIVANENQI